MFKIASQIYVLKGNYKRQDLAAFMWANFHSLKHSCQFGEIIQWPTLFQGIEVLETQSAEEGCAALDTK